MNTVLRWYEQHIELAAALGIELGTGFDLEQAPATQTAPVLERGLESAPSLDIAKALALDPQSAPASATALSPATDYEPGLYPESLRPAVSRRCGGECGLYSSGSYPSHPATSPSHKVQRHRSGLH
ncbi:hypothetical protein D3C75_377810 [compost metagenome]